jgi:DNA-binding XRE family transcriptional regulator
MSDQGSARGPAENPQEFRRSLGRALRAARDTAGFSQEQLARRTGHARSTISMAERGAQDMSRVFWQRCDDALAPDPAFAALYERLTQIRSVTRSLDTRTVTGALAAYQALGWGAQIAGGRVMLICGAGIDALEVPRATGVLAIHWWLYTRGAPDEIRGLPGLPSPAAALAVVGAGDRCYFLTQPGAFPWAELDPANATPDSSATGPEVRWHTGGSRIPAPPGPDTGEHRVEWAHPPPARPRLADPVILLDLLSRVTVLAGHRNHVLTLPGGLRVVPAPRSPALRATDSG